MLRHAEGRYEKHLPNEKSKTFEHFMTLGEEPELREVSPENGLVLIAAFDGIGGARRALELLNLKPAVYISIEKDDDCVRLVKGRWPEVVSFSDAETITVQELSKELCISRLKRTMIVFD